MVEHDTQLTLREQPIAGAWVIESQASNAAVGELAGVLSIRLRNNRHYVVTASEASAEKLPALFDTSLVVACSQQRSWFVLEGGSARTMLDRFTALDLRLTRFSVGATASGRIGQFDVMLHARVDQGFDVFPLRSYADALGHFMQMAGADDGWSLRIVSPS